MRGRHTDTLRVREGQLMKLSVGILFFPRKQKVEEHVRSLSFKTKIPRCMLAFRGRLAPKREDIQAGHGVSRVWVLWKSTWWRRVDRKD